MEALVTWGLCSNGNTRFYVCNYIYCVFMFYLLLLCANSLEFNLCVDLCVPLFNKVVILNFISFRCVSFEFHLTIYKGCVNLTHRCKHLPYNRVDWQNFISFTSCFHKTYTTKAKKSKLWVSIAKYLCIKNALKNCITRFQQKINKDQELKTALSYKNVKCTIQPNSTP